MKPYTLQERIEIIEIHYKYGENSAETVRKTPTFLGRSDVKNKTRARRSRTAENIAAAGQSVKENPGLFIPRRSLE